MKYIFYILAFTISFATFSQENTDVIEPNNIKTVILRPLSSNNYAPIIPLNKSFIFSFDDLSDEMVDYYYKIEHYTYDWKLSGLSDREYIKGYSEDRIREYDNAFNTLQFFTHYKVIFPNENTRIIKSGNYKITVLNEDDDVIFTRKFVLYETKVQVGITVHRSRDVVNLNEKQSVQFIINHPNLLVNNPKEELKTVLLQNNDWNTAITNLQPQFYRGTQMLFKYTDKMNFWAGNEFLYFDSKAVRSATLNIARVDSGPNLYHTILYTNQERIDMPYTNYPDINGNFVIRNIYGEDNNLESDYTWVFFSLESYENIGDKKIYVNGSFNNWRNEPANQMVYNSKTGLYEAKILLKQGFYNYQYVTVDKNNKISNHDIDGSFYQTENQYSVLVYYHKFGSRYDSVIGFGQGNSEKIQN